jgi:hypothetical protein
MADQRELLINAVYSRLRTTIKFTDYPATKSILYDGTNVPVIPLATPQDWEKVAASRWNLRRASDRAMPNQAPGMVGEGVETGWRASFVDEGTVRLSLKGESDRITQRSAVQIRSPQP